MFKRLIITACSFALLATATPVQARYDYSMEEISDFCFNLGSLARNVMHARQSGDSMQSLMDTAVTVHPTTRPVTIALVREAFNTPRFYTAEHQQRAIEGFADKAVSACEAARYATDAIKP